jgi:hypothetical protein
MDRPCDERRNGCRLSSPGTLRFATLCPRTLFYASTRGTAPDYSEKYVTWYRSAPNPVSAFVSTIRLLSLPRRVVARSVKPAFVLQAVNVAFPLNQELSTNIGSGRLLGWTETEGAEDEQDKDVPRSRLGSASRPEPKHGGDGSVVALARARIPDEVYGNCKDANPDTLLEYRPQYRSSARCLV